MATKRKVAYFYDQDIGQFYYGQGHPMKPHRIRMAHSLILHYGLYEMMEVFRPHPASEEDMVKFHNDDYIFFLKHITPDNQDQFTEQLKLYNVGEDCPVFDGLYQYCTKYVGGSIGGAVKLNHGSSDIVINWAGGLHHAKKSEASGFCYVNDIVLAILELLKYNQRVLYVDIDMHHGDGVEEAFLTTDRVMTVSFHKFGDGFFPGTGDIVNVGHDKGKHFAVNAPLKDGMTDEAYESLFKPVMRHIMEVYQPDVIVYQSGADSLGGDRLGVFNLTIAGHAECLKYMQGFNVPMLVLGGGGYKISNVARCWAYETGAILGAHMEDRLPPNEYFEYYGPDYRLSLPVGKGKENLNSSEYLEQLKRRLMENISRAGTAQGVAFHERAPDAMPEDRLQQPEDQMEESPEHSKRLWDGRPVEAEAGRPDRHEHSYNGDHAGLRRPQAAAQGLSVLSGQVASSLQTGDTAALQRGQRSAIALHPA